MSKLAAGYKNNQRTQRKTVIESDKSFEIRFGGKIPFAFSAVGRLSMKESVDGGMDILDIVVGLRPNGVKIFKLIKDNADWRTGFSELPPKERGMNPGEASIAIRELVSKDVIRRMGKRNWFMINPKLIVPAGDEQRGINIMWLLAEWERLGE